MLNKTVTFSKLLILITIINIFFSCKKKEDDIPDTPVNISIYLNDALYRDLRTIGNAIKITGGHAGIIVYRLSQTEFIAFDRLCPYEQKTSCRLQDTDNNLFYECDCCHTPYMLLDGIGQENPDRENPYPGENLFLKEYRVNYDGVNIVRISNF